MRTTVSMAVAAVICITAIGHLICPGAVTASNKSLLVGISPFKPFVIPEEDALSGYSIDLWREIAAELKLEYRFVRSVGISGTLTDVIEKRVDAAIGGLAINAERERQIDFTYPYFRTGLGILVPRKHGLNLGPFLDSFLTRNKLWVIGLFLVFMIAAGHAIWLIERKIEPGRRSFSSNYFPGVIEGMYWAVVTASTVGYGDRVARTWYGRVLTLLLIIISLPIFAYFIATMSSSFTIETLRTSIGGPQDLVERRVGVLDGSTSQEYMRNMRAVVYAFDRIEDAYKWLIDGRLDAVVYDRPNLQYFTQHEGKGKVEVVGRTFAPQDYGVAIQQGSPLREELNRALLAMRENGALERIRARWFGHDN